MEDEINDLDDADEAAANMTADTLQRHLDKLTNFQNERKQASERVTEARKEAKEAGIDMTALSIVSKLSKMEPEERQVYLFTLNRYAALLRFN